eukprot:TRINITY_DN1244_c0_g1_i9.p1 TRINITY_DN1244_c0_g1~~TRINITY_DN1244_c0_g1_i9.p1  ORF type:complete len:241 (+),score=35.90 TRINITY_DN1244_c0_g1_i9:66-788(+)
MCIRDRVSTQSTWGITSLKICRMKVQLIVVMTLLYSISAMQASNSNNPQFRQYDKFMTKFNPLQCFSTLSPLLDHAKAFVQLVRQGTAEQQTYDLYADTVLQNLNRSLIQCGLTNTSLIRITEEKRAQCLNATTLFVNNSILVSDLLANQSQCPGRYIRGVTDALQIASDWQYYCGVNQEWNATDLATEKECIEFGTEVLLHTFKASHAVQRKDFQKVFSELEQIVSNVKSIHNQCRAQK